MSGAKYTSRKNEVNNAVKEAIARALEICGGTAERYTKDNLERNHSVQTSRLINSIAHRQKDTYTESIGTTVEYAPYVEFGHHQKPGRYVPAIGKRLVAKYVAAKPYLRPAVEDHRSEYENIIKGELDI